MLSFNVVDGLRLAKNFVPVPVDRGKKTLSFMAEFTTSSTFLVLQMVPISNYIFGLILVIARVLQTEI